ncbi:MAG: SEC-C metal-binding domain-containing protein, partial [Dokdonella sp.]
FREKEAMIGGESMRGLEKHVMLSVVDNSWKEHLASMDYMRQGIYLRGYAQKQPKQEFKREAFILFQQMLERIKHEIVQTLARIRIRTEDEVAEMEAQQKLQAEQQARVMKFQHDDASIAAGLAAEAGEGENAAAGSSSPTLREGPKVGRNDPCPCGSGKKFKQCHGRIE